MRCRLLALVLCASSAYAADWQEIRSGPYLVFTDAGADEARDAVNHLEQFRHALGQAFGRTELTLAWPVTVVVQKQARASLNFGRDGWYATWPAGAVPPPDFFAKLGQLFLDDNLSGRMPPGYESALASAYSTLAVDGLRLTFGAPPPPAERTLQWAMIHMLTTNPETSGRVRVLLSNLANGAETGASFRNAFQQDQAAIEARAKAYLDAGNFGKSAVNARPLDPRRLTVREALPSRVRALPGDLLLASGDSRKAVAAYRAALNERPSAILHEGYGLAILAVEGRDAAKAALISAVSDPDAKPARAYLELARIEPGFLPPIAAAAKPAPAAAAPRKPSDKPSKPSRAEEEASLGAGTQVDAGTFRIGAPKVDAPEPEPAVSKPAKPAQPEKPRSLIERAADANPRWADPYIVGAELEPGPIRKAALLKKAAELAPRRVDLWQRLAEAQAAAKEFDDATKSWLAAERAASSPEERERIIEARRASDTARLDAAAEARRREAQEKANEIARLREENDTRIRAAEERANQGSGAYKPSRKVEQWWDGPKTESVIGTLTRVDCVRGRATLRVTPQNGAPIALSVPDVTKLSLIGGASATLACGVQSPARAVKVEYLPANAQSAGPEAVTIEFR